MFNAQGDVVALVDGTGKVVVEYSYDAWGQPLTITGSMKDTLGKANPLRYRCYVYDEETGMYYLGSRYYNPVMGRFINADNVIPGIGGDLRGYSAFAYCFNNPINMCDLSGHWPKWIEDVNNWFIDNVVKPTKQFVKDIKKDVKNFDINNKSERKVLESNYFSCYKGVPVIRINGDRSGTFGAIFLTRETNDRKYPEDIVRYKYGHTIQMEKLGIVKYALCIGVPSWREWGTGEYYSKPWEVTADIYGGVLSRNHSQSSIENGFAYLKGSQITEPLIWILEDY